MRRFRMALVAVGLLLLAAACSPHRGLIVETTPQEYRGNEVIRIGPIL